MKHYQEWLIKHRTLTRDTTKQGWISNFQNNWTGNDKSDKGNDLPWNNYKHEKFIINKATINSRDVLEINLSKNFKNQGSLDNHSQNSLFWNFYAIFHLRVYLTYIHIFPKYICMRIIWNGLINSISLSLEHFF